jgi:serine/threonine protein phosphatase PrpC
MLLTPDRDIVANAGDSRTSLSRKGKAIDLSYDHQPDLPSEGDRIRRAGGDVMMGRVNGGVNFSRALGLFDYKQNAALPYS